MYRKVFKVFSPTQYCFSDVATPSVHNFFGVAMIDLLKSNVCLDVVTIINKTHAHFVSEQFTLKIKKERDLLGLFYRFIFDCFDQNPKPYSFFWEHRVESI